MTKKKIVLWLLCIIIVCVIYVYTHQVSLEEALQISPQLDYQIVHTEAIDNKVIVVMDFVEEDGVSFAVLKKGILGYKQIYSGASGDYRRTVEKMGMIFVELPRSIMNGRSICFGMMNDMKIKEVELVSENERIKVELDTSNFWFLDTSQFNSNLINVVAYDQSSQIIFQFEQRLAWL